MSMYAILLAQSVEDPIVSDVEYAYGADGAANGEANNGTSGGFPGHAEMRDGRGGAGGGESPSSSAALLAAESALDLNGLMSVLNPLNWFKDNSAAAAGFPVTGTGQGADSNDTVG